MSQPGRFLRKETKRTYEPGRAGHPGRPGRPPTPARSRQCRTTGTAESCAPVIQREYSEITGWTSVVTGYRCTDVTQRSCTPARPARPGRPAIPERPPRPGEWKTEQNFGWNAGARSIERRTGDFLTRFRVGQDVGVAVGVSRSKGTEYHYRQFDYCMRMMRGELRIFEGGTEVAGPFDYGRSDRFAIHRVAGVVQYWKNGELLYRSTKPSTRSMVVVSSLYSGGDRVI